MCESNGVHEKEGQMGKGSGNGPVVKGCEEDGMGQYRVV
jgi:hypothetical protein